MELSGTIQGRGALTGSFDFDQVNYELLKNKPRINGVELIGNKTSEDLHIEPGGGGGGTNNYNNLENKPKINGVILQDELSLHSLGIQSEIEFSGEPTEYLNGSGQFTTPRAAITYSTDEQIIGKWIDGKPLYQRTFDMRERVIPNTTWTENLLGTTGITIRTIDAYTYLGDTMLSYDFYRTNNSFFTWADNGTHEDISVRPNLDTGGATIYAGIVTIQYTKNTD